MRYPFLLLCTLFGAMHGFAAAEALSLDQALELARIHSPELKAARLQTRAAELAVRAHGRWKNPALNFEAEGIGGDYNGFGSTEYTLALQQTFERGGKRKYDRTVAEKSIGIAFQAEAEKELALLADVRLVFIEIAALQEMAEIGEEQEKLAEDFTTAATRRFEAGGASELEVVEAELARSETQLAQLITAGALKSARIQLASLIGVPESEMGTLTADFYQLPDLGIVAVPDSHPALKRLAAAADVKRAEAARAKASDAADITLGAGVRYEADADYSSLVFGASMPLNFVRPGKAAQGAALSEADAIQLSGASVQRRLKSELAVLAAVYAGSKKEAALIRDQLIPQAEKAFELSRTGYDAGRFSWIEMINARKHRAELRVRYIEALKQAHFALAEITRFMHEGI